MSVTVKEVQSKNELRQFVKFPLRLYKDCPYYVPSIYIDEMSTLVAGRVAEEIVNDGVPCTGALNDFERMTKMAYAMVTYYGMSEKVGNLSFYNMSDGYDLTKPYSEKTAELIDSEVKTLVDQVTERTRKLLLEHWDGLTKLAEQLISKEVIMAEDIEAIFGPKAGKHGEERLAQAPETEAPQAEITEGNE